MSFTPGAGDATTTSKGIVQLSGDFGGSAGAPTVPGLAAKAPLASPAFTGTPTGITKAHVGLGNVDNTSDTAKPISTATLTAMNARLTWRGAFAQSTVYAVNDVITANGATYRCQTAHTAGPSGPATDGDATYWERIGTVTAAGAVTYTDSKTTYRVFKEAGGNWPGGTASTWTRPTSLDTVSFELVGPDPSPGIVTSGTGGMRAGLDIRSRTA